MSKTPKQMLVVGGLLALVAGAGGVFAQTVCRDTAAATADKHAAQAARLAAENDTKQIEAAKAQIKALEADRFQQWQTARRNEWMAAAEERAADRTAEAAWVAFWQGESDITYGWENYSRDSAAVSTAQGNVASDNYMISNEQGEINSGRLSSADLQLAQTQLAADQNQLAQDQSALNAANNAMNADKAFIATGFGLVLKAERMECTGFFGDYRPVLVQHNTLIPLLGLSVTPL